MNSADHRDEPIGDHIGDLKIASEAVEVAICLLPTVIGFLAWQTGLIKSSTMVAGVLAAIGICYALYKAISGSWSVHDSGFTVRIFGASEQTFDYSGVRSVTAKKTHHLHGGAYVGTKAELILSVRKAELKLKTDYRHPSDKERVVCTLLDRCSEAIEMRLLSTLKQQGEVHWTKNIYLTATGLRVADSEVQSREIPFESIDELKIVENQLKIWTSGDVLPILVMPNSEVNFIPKFRLFYSLTATTHKLHEAASTLAQSV